MFDDIRKNLDLLEAAGCVSDGALLDSMRRLYSDAAALNGVRSVSKFPAGAPEEYGNALVNLLTVLETSYNSRAAALDALRDEDVDELRAACTAMRAKLEELRPLLEALQEQRTARQALADRLDAAEKERARLEQELAALGEASPEGLEQQNAALAKQLAEKKALAEQLDDLRTQTAAAKRDADALAEQVRRQEQEKKDEEARLSRLRAQADEYDRWTERLPELRAEVEGKAAGLESALTLMENARGAWAQRGELPEVFGTKDAFKDFPQGIGSFEQLQTWFRETGEGLGRLLDAYSATYRAALTVTEQAAQTATAAPEQKN